MAESVPPTLSEQIRQLNRSLMERVIDKAASDSEWKQRLLEDSEAAMMEADFPEARQLREMQASVRAKEDAEVTGHLFGGQQVDNSNCVFTVCPSHPVYKSI
jgi:hypothetical protein